jgi:hypothetical protein
VLGAKQTTTSIKQQSIQRRVTCKRTVSIFGWVLGDLLLNSNTKVINNCHGALRLTNPGTNA